MNTLPINDEELADAIDRRREWHKSMNGRGLSMSNTNRSSSQLETFAMTDAF